MILPKENYMVILVFLIPQILNCQKRTAAAVQFKEMQRLFLPLLAQVVTVGNEEHCKRKSKAAMRRKKQNKTKTKNQTTTKRTKNPQTNKTNISSVLEIKQVEPTVCKSWSLLAALRKGQHEGGGRMDTP